MEVFKETFNQFLRNKNLENKFVFSYRFQVNNTHNVSYGGSNNVTNVAYSKYSSAGGSTTLASSSSGRGTSSNSKSFSTHVNPEGKDQDVVVLLPPRKNRTPRIRHKLSVRYRKTFIETFLVHLMLIFLFFFILLFSFPLLHA